MDRRLSMREVADVVIREVAAPVTVRATSPAVTSPGGRGACAVVTKA